MDKKETSWLEKHLMPVAAKLSQNICLVSLRDGIAIAMPLIIIGSFFMILNQFPIPGWPQWLAATKFHGASIADIFAKIVNGSFGLLGLVSCFGIASSYAEQRKTDGKSAGVIAISSYFIVTPSIMSSGKLPLEGMPYGFLGSKGLFIAIIIGLITGQIFQWFINHNIQIKLPDAVPPAVAKSFSALIPGAVIITIFGGIYALFTLTGWGNVHQLIFNLLSKPLGLLGDTLIGTLVAIFLNSAFWFIGIHGANVVNNVMQPMWLMNNGANQALHEAGKLDLAHGGHIITQPFIDNFVFMGGSGATIGLVLSIAIIVWRKKSSQTLDMLAPITITPALFNINEPTMFGLPVVLNLSLIIPFLIAPMINAIITYFAMKFGWVPLCTGAVISWTTPPLISGFLATSSYSAIILQAVNIVIDVLIYLPFVATYDKQLKLQEAEVGK